MDPAVSRPQALLAARKRVGQLQDASFVEVGARVGDEKNLAIG